MTGKVILESKRLIEKLAKKGNRMNKEGINYYLLGISLILAADSFEQLATNMPLIVAGFGLFFVGLGFWTSLPNKIE